MSGTTAEILSIGTELLLGEILDTNSQFLAQALAKLGINCYFRSTVGDNKERLKEALKLALDRSDLVITTGGLGPTADDLTTECIAELVRVPLNFDEELYAEIERFFKERGIKRIPESNKKQALRPAGAAVLPNPTGTAPGLIFSLSEKLLAAAEVSDPQRPRTILTFPGVPSELKVMWSETAEPFILETYSKQAFYSVELKHFGIGESALAEQFSHLLAHANPTVAPYASRGECRLRVTARAETLEAAKLLCQPIIDEVRAGSGLKCYGFDSDSLPSVVGDLLCDRKLTLSLAESCTGGMISALLTDRPGSSDYTFLNVVTYSNAAKAKLLDVPEAVLSGPGAVSPESARHMAEGVRRLSETDLALSVTGIAGPAGGSDEKPVGLVYLGLAAEGFYAGRRLRFSSRLSRDDIRYRTALEALNTVRTYLLAPETYPNELPEVALKEGA